MLWVEGKASTSRTWFSINTDPMRVESDFREMWCVGDVADADEVSVEVAICEEVGRGGEACDCKRYLRECCDISIRFCRSQRKICWRRAEELVGVDIGYS
jgi:hypothetical protein